MILRVNGVNPIVATTTAVRAGASDYSNVTLGTSSYPWKAVYGTALYGTTIYENGTSIASKYLPLAGGSGFRLFFSQADTLCFSPGPVKIQIRARLRDGNAVASDIISTTALEVLKDGEI